MGVTETFGVKSFCGAQLPFKGAILLSRCAGISLLSMARFWLTEKRLHAVLYHGSSVKDPERVSGALALLTNLSTADFERDFLD
jgi:hypothetical protein